MQFFASVQSLIRGSEVCCQTFKGVVGIEKYSELKQLKHINYLSALIHFESRSVSVWRSPLLLRICWAGGFHKLLHIHLSVTSHSTSSDFSYRERTPRRLRLAQRKVTKYLNSFKCLSHLTDLSRFFVLAAEKSTLPFREYTKVSLKSH